jgi:hypothetical protein
MRKAGDSRFRRSSLNFLSAFLFRWKFAAHSTGRPLLVQERALTGTGTGKSAIFL